jgi:iron(III) transport system substrate-binding protein
MRKGIRNPLYLGVPLAIGAMLVTACSSSSPSTPSSGSGATATTGATSAASTSAPGATSAAPGDLGPQKAALEALYSQAVAAGQTSVVLYGPSTGSDQTEYKAFQADFPKITASGVPVVGPPMDAKLAAEFSSGKHIADIAYTGDTDLVIYQANGWLTKFTPITVSSPADLEPESVGPGDTFYGVATSVSAIVTSSNSSVPVPQTWADLESPTYKGKIAMYDPTAVGIAADNFAHLDLIPADKGLMAALKANDAQLFPSSNITGPLTAVAQGSKSVAAPMSYAFYLQAKASGAPVTFSLLKADNYEVTLYDAIVKGAPDPLAAQLYEDWMFTPDAQKAIAAEGSFSTVTGAPAPQGLPTLSAIPLQPPIPIAQVTAADNSAIAAAKQYWGG